MITELENKLLFELKKEKYNLTKADIEHLEYIHQSRVFYNISDISNKFTVIELKGEKGFKANIKIKCVSQVVDVPPAVSSKDYILLFPALVIYCPKHDTVELSRIAMHELCHLYSVGSYNLTDSDKFIFSHKCGINKYEYYSNDGLKKHVISEDYFLNELFNDFVANFLFDKIYGKPYYQYRSLKDFTDKLINYLNDSNIDIFKFIGSYFSDADNSILELIKNI